MARKAPLSGLKKVEEDARTADYKSVMYATKIFKTKPEYLAASEVEQVAMIQQNMRDTIEKRRRKGQDTMSKVAAYKAGDPRALRLGAASKVPLKRMLVKSGLLPARSEALVATGAGKRQRREESPDEAETPSSSSSATGFPGRRSNNAVVDTASRSPERRRMIKASATPAPFANMTPEPMDSIEGEDGGQDEVAALRSELHSMRNMLQNVLNNNGNAGGAEGIARVTSVEERLARLEKVVYAIRNTAIPEVVGRVGQLEGGAAGGAQMQNMLGGRMRQMMARHGSSL